MVNHAPVIYSYSLACCSGGGRQQSVDNDVDSAWKEIKNLSMTTNIYFLVTKTFHFSVQNLQWFPQSFSIIAELLCLKFRAHCQFILIPLILLAQDH